jgi:hypothetical protein
VARSAIFIVKMMPGPPSRILGRIIKRPVIEKLSFSTPLGQAEADLYRPPSRGPHPGIVVSLGVLPAGVVDPRTAMVAEALACSGFAALLHWSPSTRDLRLDPADIGPLVSAYQVLTGQPYVDAGRSGLLGVCIGGSFALIAAARPEIRDRVTFLATHSPYSSLWTLAVDIASGARTLGDVREPWDVDPLTWKVYVRSVAGWLHPAEARRLCDAFEDRIAWNATRTEIVRSPIRDQIEPGELSEDGRAILRLLAAGPDDVEDALRALPPAASALLATMSPLTYVDQLAVPRILLLHDRYDHMIPVGESRRLWAALSGRPGASYTEMGLRHLRIPPGWSPPRVAREMARAYLAWYPLFRATT